MSKATILFADNDRSFLETWAEQLEEEDYRVIAVETCTSARQILSEEQLQLAILDLRLVDDNDSKDTSGIEIAIELARSIPKIILTDHFSARAARAAFKPQIDGLPSVFEFVDKREGIESLKTVIIDALGRDLEWMRSVKSALARSDSDLIEDYKNAQGQAKSNYVASLVIAIIGAVVAFAGIGLALGKQVEVGWVSTLTGVVTEVVSILFFKRVDNANSRMDRYHLERIDGQRFEILLKACDSLTNASYREEARKEIIQAARTRWLVNLNGKRRGAKPEKVLPNNE